LHKIKFPEWIIFFGKTIFAFFIKAASNYVIINLVHSDVNRIFHFFLAPSSAHRVNGVASAPVAKPILRLPSRKLPTGTPSVLIVPKRPVACAVKAAACNIVEAPHPWNYPPRSHGQSGPGKQL
jgi:hypothetical protein